MLLPRVGLLLVLSLALSAVNSTPLPVKGKENVFKYSIKVGKNAGPTFKQGFLIDVDLSVRKKTDETFFFKVTNVEVRCHRNQPIKKERYSELESQLKAPFEFNTKDDHGLTVYAPDVTDSESANIKRGLINVIEFYDSDSKKIQKLAPAFGPSGKCPDNTIDKDLGNVTETLRMTNLEANCTADKPRQLIKKNFVANKGTFCELEPKVSRNVAYRITKSKDGSDSPSILIKATESIRLASLTGDSFDEVQVHSTLKLVEVKDATPEEAPTGSTTKSCLEIVLKPKKPHDHSGEQTELLAKARHGLEMVQHCLHRLDQDGSLEEQSIPQAVVFLTHSLKHLNKESLLKLYDSAINDSALQQQFFQLLAMDPSHDAFDAVQEIYLKSLEGDVTSNPVADNVQMFFESLDHKGRGVGVSNVKKFSAFLDKVQELDPSNNRLKNSIVLAGSGIIFENCLRKGKQDEACSTPEEYVAKMNAKDPENKDEDMTLRKLDAISNMQLAIAFPFVKKVIDDPKSSLYLRSSAAWKIAKLIRKAPEAVTYAKKLFYDRKEDHEIRIAAFVALAVGSPSELQPAVQYLIDNNDNEDRQVVSYAISTVKSMQAHKNPDGSKCRNYVSDVPPGLDGLVASVYDKLGPKDLFDSATYAYSTPDRREFVKVSIIASKTDIIPRTVFIKMKDPMQSRAYVLHSISDAFLYNNIVQLKELYAKFKKENKVTDGPVKSQLDAIFDKVKGKPTDSYFAMSFIEMVDGIVISHQKFNKPEELIGKVFSITLGNEKYARTFRKYNDLGVEGHSESGIKVKFMTAQSAVSSFEIPVFNFGTPGKAGHPVSLRYSYKFVSKTAHLTMVLLPNSKFRYVTGRISDKHMSLPRNATVTIMPKKSADGKIARMIAKVKDEPLFGKEEIDLFYRAVSPVEGNMESPDELEKLVKKDTKPLDTHGHFFNYFGFGIEVAKTLGYSRPMPWKSPLSRVCPVYQEIENKPESPFKYKVTLKKNNNSASSSSLNYEVNFVQGDQSDHFISLLGLTVQNPLDDKSKSIRFVSGIGVNMKDPSKRVALFSYENYVKKIFLRSWLQATMPEDKTFIPAITKNSAEWKEVYGKQQIDIKGKYKWTATARNDFGEDDINDLINGLGDDVDATSTGLLYRTEEQKNLFSAFGNSVDDSTDDNLYSHMISRGQVHAKCNLRTWSEILKFNGMKGEIKLNKKLPDPLEDLRRKIHYYIVMRFWPEMTEDINDQAPEGTFIFSANSTVDGKFSDSFIKDKSGSRTYRAIRSYALKYLRPSLSPIKVFESKTLNSPVCSITSEPGRNEIETFSSRDIMTEDLVDGCEYLLTSNCRGLKNFAITYSKKDHVYKILFDNKHEIIISKDGITFDGEKKVETDGMAIVDDMMYVGRYRGLLGVILPNYIAFAREVGSPNAYISAPRLFRGRLCGLCGASDGNTISDDVSSLSEFGVKGTCPA